MWATLKPFVDHSHRRGFTIVELLIVIVVIGILAAITIIAYSGIQQRASASASQSAASQAAKKLLAYAVDNSDSYPATLTVAGINDNSGTTFQYSVNNAATPKTFCVTATTSTASYWVSNASTTPTSGGCPGHGVGGTPPITNLATNPSLETGLATGISSTGWIAGAGMGTILATVPSDGGYSGSYYRRWTMGGTNTSIAQAVSNGYVTVDPSSTVTMSFWVRSSTSMPSVSVQLPEYTSVGGGGSSPASTASSGVAVSAGVWQRISYTRTVTSTTNSLRSYLRIAIGGTSNGQTIDLDAIMTTVGPTLYNFADGNSPGWAWSGAQDASASIGPPL